MDVRENNEQRQNNQIEENCEDSLVNEEENDSNPESDEGIFIFLILDK